MPSDNSCLFTAFGGALPNQLPAHQLRRMMAEYILEHPDTYTEAVLGSPPSQYCRSIQDPDRWGGGIELSILSSIFEIQICTFDVQVCAMNFRHMLDHSLTRNIGPELDKLWRGQARALYSLLLRSALRPGGIVGLGLSSHQHIIPA